METKRLYRKENDRVFGGVCSGLGDYFDVDKVLIRLLWALAVVVGGIGLIAYIIAWIIIPSETTVRNR